MFDIEKQLNRAITFVGLSVCLSVWWWLSNTFIKVQPWYMYQYASKNSWVWHWLKALLSKNWFSFFSFSDAQKFHHLLGCHSIGINSSLVFFKCFAFFRFNMASQKSDNVVIDWQKKTALIRLKIKIICLTKKLS